MSSIMFSNYSPSSTVFPLKTMLLNCSGVSSAQFPADINDIFVILVLCGIWAESYNTSGI